MHLVIRVNVDGQNIPISLEGGINSPRRINGSYSTNDPKLQAAIEKHPGYGKKFQLTKTINMNPAPPPVVEDPAEVVKEKPQAYISPAKNATQAKAELNKKFKISWSNLKNIPAVLKFAEEFNIEYPNWERE